jgi:predicted CXXCH cytochrome family protein
MDWNPAPVVRKATRVAAALLLASAPAAAFHEQGVAGCDGCHTMHNSRDDAPVGSGPGAALLRAETATEVCLLCHETSHGAVLGSDPLNPPPELGAGSFTYLLEDDLNDATGDPASIGGYRAGHSIVVPSRHLDTDPERPFSPGGSYPSDQLGCTSCHDPHGSTDFRMLRGEGPAPGGFVFVAPPPAADGIDPDTDVESPTRHTAYRSGWSEWCANCHAHVHEGPDGFVHPTDAELESTSDTYNAYDGPSNPDGGSYATAYVPEVPFEDPSSTVDGTTGPTASSRITCLTCHRAHATSAPAALRWDPNVLRLSDDGLASLSYPIPSPYADPEQRALCVKCHYPEAVDHGLSQPCLECHRSGTAAAGRFGPGFPGSGALPGGAYRR